MPDMAVHLPSSHSSHPHDQAPAHHHLHQHHGYPSYSIKYETMDGLSTATGDANSPPSTGATPIAPDFSSLHQQSMFFFFSLLFEKKMLSKEQRQKQTRQTYIYFFVLVSVSSESSPFGSNNRDFYEVMPHHLPHHPHPLHQHQHLSREDSCSSGDDPQTSPLDSNVGSSMVASKSLDGRQLRGQFIIIT